MSSHRNLLMPILLAFISLFPTNTLAETIIFESTSLIKPNKDMDDVGDLAFMAAGLGETSVTDYNNGTYQFKLLASGNLLCNYTIYNPRIYGDNLIEFTAKTHNNVEFSIMFTPKEIILEDIFTVKYTRAEEFQKMKSYLFGGNTTGKTSGKKPSSQPSSKPAAKPQPAQKAQKATLDANAMAYLAAPLGKYTMQKWRDADAREYLNLLKAATGSTGKDEIPAKPLTEVSFSGADASKFKFLGRGCSEIIMLREYNNVACRYVLRFDTEKAAMDFGKEFYDAMQAKGYKLTNEPTYPTTPLIFKSAQGSGSPTSHYTGVRVEKESNGSYRVKIYISESGDKPHLRKFYSSVVELMANPFGVEGAVLGTSPAKILKYYQSQFIYPAYQENAYHVVERVSATEFNSTYLLLPYSHSGPQKYNKKKIEQDANYFIASQMSYYATNGGKEAGYSVTIAPAMLTQNMTFQNDDSWKKEVEQYFKKIISDFKSAGYAVSYTGKQKKAGADGWKNLEAYSIRKDGEYYSVSFECNEAKGNYYYIKIYHPK